MSWRVLLIALGVFFVGGVLLFAAIVQLPTVDNTTLAERCAASAPSWQKYPEDIKGQVGAGPVAEWSGAIIAAALVDGELRLTFDLQGPWVERPFGLPILIRDNYGQVLLSREARGEGARREYIFRIPGGGALTWFEVVTPEGRRRITLGPDKTWTEE